MIFSILVMSLNRYGYPETGLLNFNNITSVEPCIQRNNVKKPFWVSIPQSCCFSR